MKKLYQAPKCKMVVVVNSGMCQNSFPIYDENSNRPALGKDEIEGLSADNIWDMNDWFDFNE